MRLNNHDLFIYHLIRVKKEPSSSNKRVFKTNIVLFLKHSKSEYLKKKITAPVFWLNDLIRFPSHLSDSGIKPAFRITAAITAWASHPLPKRTGSFHI
jgi:hypothetical protein